MIFRQATEKDLDGILAMVGRVIRCPGTLWNEEYPTRPDFEESLSQDGLYVAEDEGRIVATAGIAPATGMFADSPCWTPAKHPCEGSRLGIDPAYQGRHLAIPFQRYCLNDAAGRLGYDAFRFLVGQSLTRAIHVYERFGFKRVGETNWIDIDWFFYECTLPVPEEGTTQCGC